jgi:hypothetical protein
VWLGTPEKRSGSSANYTYSWAGFNEVLINIANHRDVITTLLAKQWKLPQDRFLAYCVMGE